MRNLMFGPECGAAWETFFPALQRAAAAFSYWGACVPQITRALLKLVQAVALHHANLTTSLSKLNQT